MENQNKLHHLSFKKTKKAKRLKNLISQEGKEGRKIWTNIFKDRKVPHENIRTETLYCQVLQRKIEARFEKFGKLRQPKGDDNDVGKNQALAFKGLGCIKFARLTLASLIFRAGEDWRVSSCYRSHVSSLERSRVGITRESWWYSNSLDKTSGFCFSLWCAL